ncbi:hypothetical protein X943_002620 [Babesia divergens]|uniref:Uncharacterized protein n=1 Tax=Babesia divergens TaxID=32595 RepID=A0AAD9GDB4_BABDI|nr:hypothetical protein X943_002620 [Babesia divergens]
MDARSDASHRLTEDGLSDNERGRANRRVFSNASSSSSTMMVKHSDGAPRRQSSFSSVSRNCDELSINQRIKQADERKQWSSIKSLMKKLNALSDSLDDVGWGPAYDIPAKPTRKGPTLGLFFGQAKRAENCSVILQTPDAMERYSFYGKLLQHTSCSPYAITKVSYGHVVGIGRCALCGTQCGKILVYTIGRFERVIVLDTLEYYGKARDSDTEFSVDSSDESSVDMANTFEINAIEFVKTFDTFARHMIVGNNLGHLLIIELPSMKLINVIYYPVEGADEWCYEDGVDCAELSEDEYDEPPPERTIRTPISMGGPSAYISCMSIYPVVNDLWVGYGDGTFAVFEIPSGRCKIHVPISSMDGNDEANIDVDKRWQRVMGIHFSTMLELTLVVYGNIRVDVWDARCYSLLKSFPASVLACGTSLISSMSIYEGYDKMCLLFVGSMDGSLILRRVERLPNNDISWSLLFNLLYDVKFKGSSNEKAQDESDHESSDFRGAPITCICPLPSHNAVIVGNACGGLVSAWNILRRIKNK